MSKCVKNKRSLTGTLHCGQHRGDDCPQDLCVTFQCVEKFNAGRLPRNYQVYIYLS